MAPPPRLLLVTPPEPDVPRLASVLPDLAGVVDAVLLRWPTVSTRETLQWVRFVAGIQPRPPLLVSDRADVALAARVGGVHLRDGALPPDRVRALGLATIGVSCHPSTGAPVPAGADFVTASPVFATTSKPQAPPLGLEGLRAFCARAGTRVLALGGITAARVSDCTRAGAWGVAVLSAVWSSPDPGQSARALRAALERA